MSTIPSDKTILGQLETIKHIHRVRHFLYLMIEELDKRARNHDQSKLESPEAEIFGEFGPELTKCEYLSPEYQETMKHVRVAIDNHYAKNRHHPEHFPNGIEGMTLCDLQEMLCDWRAATERNKNGNIRMSIEKNIARYNLSPQLVQIMQNTVREMFQD